MLVLSREKDQSVYINGEEIKITVVDIRGGRVRLGIEAPAHMSIYREELYEQIKREQEASGKSNQSVENLVGRKNNSGELEGDLEK